MLFFVDAIQGLGVFPLDVQRTPIDFLAADGHKWLLGPEGAGILYIRREWVDRLHPIGVGWNSVVGTLGLHARSTSRLKPHAGRWEGGTLNVPASPRSGASLELLLEPASTNVARRVLELTDYLCDRARRPGWRCSAAGGRARSRASCRWLPPGRDAGGRGEDAAGRRAWS